MFSSALLRRAFFCQMRIRNWALVPISLLIFLLFWYLLARLGDFPAFILPGPDLVMQRLYQMVVEGSLLQHTFVTLTEVLLGLSFGVLTATSLGYALAKITWL